MESTFCHELIHSFLFSMGIAGENHDEKFVDAMSYFLHQYLQQHGK
jgi:hypothetical protein